MDTIKRASFASKQHPAGPAPLASFEDLPSDELESPEDNIENVVKQENVVSENYSPSVSSINTPDTTTTISSQSTPRVESDFDSQFTLTPSDSSKTALTTDTYNESLSSVTKDETPSAKQKKGFTILSNSSNISNNENKNSWTEVSENHAEVGAHEKKHRSSKRKSSEKKQKSESGKNIEVRTKDKGNFFSMFKGKKNVKSPEFVVSPESNIAVMKNVNFVTNIDNTSTPDQNTNIENSFVVANGKENELPKNIELLPVHEQNDLDKTTDVQSENSTSAGNKCEFKNALNIAEKEYNIVAHEVEKGDEIADEENSLCGKIEEEEIESPESVSISGLEAKVKSLEVKENGIEAEILLPQDSSEIDDDSLVEMTPLSFKIPKPTSMKSRQQRHDVTTIPIERPRSTTPINIAPLEAFIRSSSPSFDSKTEKIKLSLPGEQFLSRLKSPKRGTSKSWTDFCVEVLQSPRMPKRDDFPESVDILNFSETDKDTTSCWNTFDAPDKNWVTFESSTEKRNLPDLCQNTVDNDEKDIGNGDSSYPYTPEEQFIKCPCNCHYEGCDNVYIDFNKFDGEISSNAVTPKIDLFSDKCQCQCHEKYLHLWSPSNFINDIDFNTTTTCSTQLSSVNETNSQRSDLGD